MKNAIDKTDKKVQAVNAFTNILDDQRDDKKGKMQNMAQKFKHNSKVDKIEEDTDFSRTDSLSPSKTKSMAIANEFHDEPIVEETVVGKKQDDKKVGKTESMDNMPPKTNARKISTCDDCNDIQIFMGSKKARMIALDHKWK